MIKFFRKIRHKLISENKFSKYVLYAVGEILLVVIGILIALQVNNWNQKRIERKIEQNYISSLIEDAKTDLANFNNVIAQSKERIKNLDSLEYMCYNYDKNDAELMMWYIKCLKFPDFITQTNRTISQLKNSGGMRLIKDETKIDAIIKYEKSFERLYNQQVWYEGGIKDLANAGISVFNYKYFPGYTRKIDKETFKTAQLLRTDKRLINELGNLATVCNAFTFAYLKFLEDGQKECHQLIDILENNNTSAQKK